MKQAPEKFRFAALAVDVLVFGIINNELHILVGLVNRPPHYVGVYGFLGGMITATETADDACARIVKEKGNLEQVYFEQLYTFSDVQRDKRNRVVSVAYIGFVRPDVAKSYTNTQANFVPLSKLKRLAYDHSEMLQVALKRLQGKLSYTTIARYLLPNNFTLSELQEVYEIVLDKKFDKRNFRKKILGLDILTDTHKLKKGTQNRPAVLYAFKSSKLIELELLI